MDWNAQLLALAHDSGVSVLTPIPSDAPISKNLPSEMQQQWVFQLSNVRTSSPVVLLRFTSKYLVVAQEDRQIVQINHLDGSSVKLGSNDKRHLDEINSLDVSEDGSVVSCGDDLQVIVWSHGDAKVTHLENVPTLVKFWMDQECDKVIVVENGNTVKVLDWRKSSWLYTIYPVPFAQGSPEHIRDVHVINGKLVVVGSGWWKEYDPSELSGGAGYTYPQREGQLSGWVLDSKYVSSTTRPLIGGIGAERSCFHDLGGKSGQTHLFKQLMPSVSVPAGAINHEGIVAVASGAKLVLLKPFETYEAVQY